MTLSPLTYMTMSLLAFLLMPKENQVQIETALTADFYRPRVHGRGGWVKGGHIQTAPASRWHFAIPL
jgi:hypothetical protein